METKEKQVIENVLDAINIAADKFKKGEEFNVEGLQILHESIRILHHVKKICHQYPVKASQHQTILENGTGVNVTTSLHLTNFNHKDCEGILSYFAQSVHQTYLEIGRDLNSKPL